MSLKPTSDSRPTPEVASDRIGPALLASSSVASTATLQEIMSQQLDAMPVVQWLSEAVQLQMQTSLELLRNRLRFARERLLEGFSLQPLPAREVDAPLTTLLATDLEGFTPMLERLGDSRAQLLMHAHNELLRACLKRHHGREVAHTGDGVLAAFRSAAHALRGAIAMQRCLADHNLRHPHTPLRVRIGLHAGVPLPEEDRLFGACVNVTVRICSVTPPGEILASDAVLAQLPAAEFRLRDRGAFALKGVAARVRLHALAWQRSAEAADRMN